MTNETLLAFITFAFVTSVTPGPNNLMLMASGANFGFVRTIPHMLGIGFGFVLMVALMGAGLSKLFDQFPLIYTGMKLIAIVYLIFLAWKIASASAPAAAMGGRRSTPLRFWQAALFQWVNPKAWAMALTAVTVYAPSRELSSVVMIALIFGLINVPTVSSWTLIGRQVSRLLHHPSRLRAFNIVMALLLIASLAPVLLV